ncbi:MAG: transketolase [Bacteroidia bacterium]
MKVEELKRICSQTRRDIVRMVHAVQSGHPGGSLGCVEFFVALYYEIMNHDGKNFTIDGKSEDLFFLSNGHISPVWYSVLARAGYFHLKELSTFRFINSRLQGHPTTHEGLPGVRVASGSLGQGLSVAIGAALTKKLNKENNLVYALIGDGEIEEGQIWEAVMFAAAKKVDNLIVTIDLNGQQIDGATKDVLPIGDVRIKFEAFGWKTLEIKDGGNIEEVISVLNAAKTETSKEVPVFIIMHTEMGNGVDFMMHSHKWHGIAPNDEQLANALGQLEETMGDY